MKIPKNIATLKPYTSARDLLNANIRVFLDANESPFESSLNRYPDPAQRALTSRISKIKEVPAEHILLSNGSDEAIDLLLKAFCAPGKDKAIILTPTYGMYQVRAQVNDVALVRVPLLDDFSPNAAAIAAAAADPDVKLILLCSPNNPTGNVFDADWIRSLAKDFHGLVVVDEAYIDFSDSDGLRKDCLSTGNLVVLQTLSKAWGMAAARLGITFASKEIINILKAIKLPYNISGPLQKNVLGKLSKTDTFARNVARIKEERAWIARSLRQLPNVESVYPSEANFVLAKFQHANEVYESLVKRGIRIRNFDSSMEGCLRISVGTKKENRLLLKEMNLL